MTDRCRYYGNLAFIDRSFNPLSPNSDQHQFSPNNIHTLSKNKVMRINEMITKEKMPRSFIKVSQLILKGNVWRSVWRICMWILGLKGLSVKRVSSLFVLYSWLAQEELVFFFNMTDDGWLWNGCCQITSFSRKLSVTFGVWLVGDRFSYQKMWLLSLRWLNWIFLGGYLPSLSINYVGMSKGMGKRLPQLYYIKMKISYDVGFIAIGVAIAT